MKNNKVSWYLIVGANILLLLIFTIKLLVASPKEKGFSNDHYPESVTPKTVSVIDYGAKGNGQQNDAFAIQKALDSGVEVVTIPSGIYSIDRTLLINSGTTLKADKEAIIRLANGAGNHVSTFLLANRNAISGNNNITVEGGIWDGNNEYNQRGNDGDRFGYTGTAINFINVTHLTIRNLTVRNPDAFSIRLGEVKDFIVEDILLDHSVVRPNQDGIHIGGFSQQGIVRQIKAIYLNTPNDDMVAINADDDVKRVINLGMKCGPIQDITVEDIQAEGAYSFIRILSKESCIKNINIKRVKGSCRFYAVNMNNWRFPLGSGNIKNVRLEDFDVTKTDSTKRDPSLIKISLKVNNLFIHNFNRGYNPETAKANTLFMDNGCENRIQTKNSKKLSSKFVIPEGNIEKLWINQSFD